MITVELSAHKGSIQAGMWLIDNITDYENFIKTWGINGALIDPATWFTSSRRNQIALLAKLINLNNVEMKKTHRVKFNFINEEDAVWFKTVWID